MAERTKAQITLRLKKVPMTVYLDAKQLKDLKALSARTGAPMQKYLRDGLDLVLAKHRRK